MLVQQIKEKCNGCSACLVSCPQKCIYMVADNEGFLYPNINEEQCINCRVCKDVCPVNAPENNSEIPPIAYAAYSKNNIIRKMSSSGGIFTHLAQIVISGGGVVFGAAMSDDFKSVHHVMVSSEDELYLLRGSKYIQSELGNAYVTAKEYLEKGILVLFSGTPCQIEGLKSYLKKEYENLFCVDVICHGVPSQKVWSKYVKYREKQVNSPVNQISFRNKKYGWKAWSLLIKFQNGRKYQKMFKNDLFINSFLNDICLRPSCYSCHFKNINHKSDITLADLWGNENICSDIDCYDGLSLVIVHSDKGEQLINEINDGIFKRRVELEKAIQHNPSMIKSAEKPQKRSAFMTEGLNNDNINTWKAYLPQKTLIRKFFRNIYWCFKTIIRLIRSKYKRRTPQ